MNQTFIAVMFCDLELSKYDKRSIALLQGVTKTKTLENEDLSPKTRLSFRDYEN